MAVHGSVAVTTVTLALMTLASSEPWATARAIGGNQDVLEHGDLQPARLQLRVHMALALTRYFGVKARHSASGRAGRTAIDLRKGRGDVL